MLFEGLSFAGIDKKDFRRWTSAPRPRQFRRQRGWNSRKKENAVGSREDNRGARMREKEEEQPKNRDTP